MLHPKKTTKSKKTTYLNTNRRNTKILKFRNYIESIEENEQILSQITSLLDVMEQSSFTVLKKNGLPLTLRLDKDMRKKCYNIFLQKIVPLNSSDEAFDDMIEEIRKRIKELS
jgi:hypothetical protein